MSYWATAENESGGVFVYILLAVALFAALTYAVSRDRNSNTDIFTEEQAKLAAQEIIEYGNTVANAVQKLRLRGCSDTEISFYTASVSVLANYQHTPETNDTCKIFHIDGGNITYLPPNVNWLDNVTWGAHSAFGLWYISGKTVINGIGTDGVSADNVELTLILPFVSQKICQEINNILGIGNVIPVDGFSWSTPFKDGNYGVGSTVTNSQLVNRTSACQTANLYWQVLIAR